MAGFTEGQARCACGNIIHFELSECSPRFLKENVVQCSMCRRQYQLEIRGDDAAPSVGAEEIPLPTRLDLFATIAGDLAYVLEQAQPPPGGLNRLGLLSTRKNVEEQVDRLVAALRRLA